MRRFILNQMPSPDGIVHLSGKDYRYLARVLRARVGSSFRALLPTGQEVVVTVSTISASRLEGVVSFSDASNAVPEDRGDSAGAGLESRFDDENRRAALPPLPAMALLQALPKGQKMDLIVRQAVEAGVSVIIPFVSERSVPRMETGKDAAAKRERWERIAREARQQSGSDISTQIFAPMNLKAALDQWHSFSSSFGESVPIILHQAPLAQGSLHGYLSGDPRAVALAVGPEGGFSSSEAHSFMDVGFRPTLVGSNVLRTETAALFAIAAVQVILLEKASWMPKHPDSPALNVSIS